MTDDKAVPARTTVRIPTASGDKIEAWVYLPTGEGPHPGVVMAHGIGAVKAGGLQPFAERFQREGFAAVVFDYLLAGALAQSPLTDGLAGAALIPLTRSIRLMG
jgi:dienelactone hydrolase